MEIDKAALLFGPYKPPALKPGDRTSCLFRDRDVVVYGWSDARISWPLCYSVGGRTGGKGILVEDEMLRAIQHESGIALQYWWGVGRTTVNRWRRAFGVRRMEPEGSRRLIHRAVLSGLAALKQNLSSEVHLWTTEELDLLGKLPDGQVAYWTGRTHNAVTIMRRALGLPAIKGSRGKWAVATSR